MLHKGLAIANRIAPPRSKARSASLGIMAGALAALPSHSIPRGFHSTWVAGMGTLAAAGTYYTVQPLELSAGKQATAVAASGLVTSATVEVYNRFELWANAALAKRGVRGTRIWYAAVMALGVYAADRIRVDFSTKWEEQSHARQVLRPANQAEIRFLKHLLQGETYGAPALRKQIDHLLVEDAGDDVRFFEVDFDATPSVPQQQRFPVYGVAKAFGEDMYYAHLHIDNGMLSFVELTYADPERTGTPKKWPKLDEFSFRSEC